MAFSLSSWFKGKPSDQGGDHASNGVPAADAAPASASAAPPAPTPAAVRTVMPKSAQPVSLRDPGTRQPVVLTASVPPPPVQTHHVPPIQTGRLPAVRPPGRKITFPVPASPRPMAMAMAIPPAAMPAPLAFASPTAPPPKPEAPDVAVILEVGDFLDRLPPGFLNAGPFDRQHQIEFRASELYSDLTKGRASVPASTIYAKYPALFARPVTDTEDVEVLLPLQKLVEQLSAAFQTRADQVAEENVGEIETPFLQVAKEDGERLPTAVGTVAGAIRPAIPLPPASAAPAPSLTENVPNFPVRPSHRTGQISTISAPKMPLEPPLPVSLPAAGAPATGPINPGKRPPSTVRASVAGGKIRLSGPSAITRMSAAPAQPLTSAAAAPTAPSTASQRITLPIQAAGPAASPSLAVSKKTARIQIPPISLRAGGQGAAPRPGAVPPSPSSVPVQPSPVSIRPPAGTDLPVTFRSSPPPSTAKPPPPSFAPAPRPNFPPPPFPAMAPAAAAPLAPTPPDDRRIELGLSAVLRGIPSESLTVEPWTVDDDVRFSLPFAGIEKQLSLGRVSISVDAFLQALPDNHRNVLSPDHGLTEIQLPLPEIFQNLPGNALTIRPDQVIEETGTLYPTPFSQKADEDAERFGVSAVPPPQTEPASAVEPAAEAVAGPVAEEAPAEAKATPLESGADRPPDLGESSPAPVEDAPVETPVDLPAGEAPAAASPAVVEDLPVEAVVEPPAAVEPAPVVEALAVLESTAPAETPEPAPKVSDPAPRPAPSAPAAPVKGKDSQLQTLFMTEEEIDAKVVVRLVCQLPGVSGCTVMFADGLRLAGNFPEEGAEGFSAMVPPFFKRTQNFVSELNLGGLKAFTVYTEKDLLSFFMQDDICVSVRHSGRGFLPGVREKLEIVTREMAGMYSTAKASPADSSL